MYNGVDFFETFQYLGVNAAFGIALRRCRIHRLGILHIVLDDITF
jgi:hypothetical protein